MHLPFTIAEPCQEDWGAMQPNEAGRHCLNCAKTVVDFTGWEVQDISAYLQQQSGERVCGRFKTSQLAPEPEKPKEIVIQEIWTSRLPEIKKMAVIICLMFGMFFVSCNSNTKMGKLDAQRHITRTANTDPGSQPGTETLGKIVNLPNPDSAMQSCGPRLRKPIKNTKPETIEPEGPYTEVTMGIPPLPPEPRPVKPNPKKPDSFIGPEQEIMGGLPAHEVPMVAVPAVDTPKPNAH